MSIPCVLRRTACAVTPALAVLLLSGCNGNGEPDAYGNFEAEEVVVAAETAGQILRLDVLEGRTLEPGEVVGVVDTTRLVLERSQLEAQRSVLEARRREANQQLRALQVQHEVALRGWERAQRLFAAGAATAERQDRAESESRVLDVQAAAARAGLERLAAEVDVLEAGIAAVDDRVVRSTLRNPVRGTVLATYARAGEMIDPGRPLYRIADLETLVLRAYISGNQLGAVRLGDPVEVRVDGPSGALDLHAGTVTWVSPRAEFTPTPIQTRDDRTGLVYAVKIQVDNPDGVLKIGMPADVSFPRGASPASPASPGAPAPTDPSASPAPLP